MKLRDLLEKVDIVDTAADMEIDITGVCFDTRSLDQGDLFVAIKGFRSDGHMFISEARDRGAACVICQQVPDAGIPYVLVKDSREALAAVSGAWFGYPASKLKVIGVTGTNGKTTVTSLIKQVIEKCGGGKTGLIGTNGNMIGDKPFPTGLTTPESYDIHRIMAEMVSEGCAYTIMEVSSHAISLKRVHGISFEVGVFTNLTADHMDFHDSMEDYARTKSLMFQHCRNAVINIDDAYAPVMSSAAAGSVFTYSLNDSAADLTAKNIKLHADKVDFCALTVGNLCRVEFPIPGMFSVYNALAVISATLLTGFDIAQITDALRTCTGVMGRAEVVPAGKDYTILIDYAHTPDALSNIIKAARSFTRGRVVTLFGCGGDRDKEKRPKMGSIAEKLSDFVIVTSDNPRTETPDAIINDILAGMELSTPAYRVIENRREAIHWALEKSQPGDVLILAGKGHETYQICGREKRHFDEREIVAEYFGKLKEETDN